MGTVEQAPAPLISIVVAVYNGAATIEACLDSVLTQSSPDWELVVIDGGSTDGTRAIIERHSPDIAYWVSEPDRGIYNAWNKALAVVRGAWVLFLGADDALAGPDVLARLGAVLEQTPEHTRVVYAAIEVVGEDGAVAMQVGEPWETARAGLPSHMSLPHQGTVCRRELFEDIGGFDERFRIAGDYELLLRELPSHDALFVPGLVLTRMASGGVSDRPSSYGVLVTENYRARRMHGMASFADGLEPYVARARVRVWLRTTFGAGTEAAAVRAYSRTIGRLTHRSRAPQAGETAALPGGPPAPPPADDWIRAEVDTGHEPGPAVSVIVPARDYARHVADAVHSVMSQAFTDWECIVVDDGSTDGTAEVVAGLAKQDARLRLLRQPPRGVASARNHGLRAARGRYIQFLDADDLLDHSKLATHVDALDADAGVDVVYGPVAYFSDAMPDQLRASFRVGGDLPGPPLSGSGADVLRPLLASNRIAVCAPLVRRSLVAAVGPFNEGLERVEDWEFWLRCAILGARFEFRPTARPLAMIRTHEASLSAPSITMLECELRMRRGVHAALGAEARWLNREGWLEAAANIGKLQILDGHPYQGLRRILPAAVAARRGAWLAWCSAALVSPVPGVRRVLSDVSSTRRQRRAAGTGRALQWTTPAGTPAPAQDSTHEPTLAAVYVSWRDESELVLSVSALREAAAASGHLDRLEIVIVVNESTPEKAAAIRDAGPGAIVIENSGNPGFGPSANMGARAVESDIVIFLNPDTTARGTPIPSILEAFRAHPHIVAVAPRLLDWPPPGDKAQARFQLRRLPRLASDVRELLLVDRFYPDNPWLRRDRYLDRDRATAFEVEQAAAAALAVRRREFDQVGGFDEQFAPAWFEDVDLCMRLRTLGGILYWPSAEFYHRGGAAAATLGRAAFVQMYYRNALRYRQEHYGRASYAAYRVALAAGMIGRALAAPIAERGNAQAAMRAYLSVIFLGAH